MLKIGENNREILHPHTIIFCLILRQKYLTPLLHSKTPQHNFLSHSTAKIFKSSYTSTTIFYVRFWQKYSIGRTWDIKVFMFLMNFIPSLFYVFWKLFLFWVFKFWWKWFSIEIFSFLWFHIPFFKTFLFLL